MEPRANRTSELERAGLIVAYTDRRGRAAHVGRTAMDVAQRTGARLILYALDDYTPLADPLPTAWSGDQEPGEFSDPLTTGDLEMLGHPALAKQVAEAHGLGISVGGWLPRQGGVDARSRASYPAKRRTMSDTIATQHAAIHLQQLPPVPADYLAEVDLEHARWSEIVALLDLLTPDERLVPGYFRDPDWTVKDLVAHLGAWLTEAATQLTNIAAHTYEVRDLDVDARNAETLAALREEPWEGVWRHAAVACTYMLQHWFALRVRSDPADLWVRKAGAEHYGEHLPRLRTWVAELVDIRTRPPSDEWDS